MFLAKVIVFCFAVLITQCKSDCSVPILSLIDILPMHISGKSILYPDIAGNIVTTNGVTIILACPGSYIVLKNDPKIFFEYEYIYFECRNKMYVNKCPEPLLKNYNIDELTCAALQPVERNKAEAGFCEGIADSSRVVIGFEFNDNIKTFIPQIEVCWNYVTKMALYALATIKYIPEGWSAQAERPPFRTGQLTDTQVNLADYYLPSFQMYNLWESYNSIPIPSFISPEVVKNNLLDRGHLVPKADFPHDAQQKLTFTYTNVAPQWGDFNKLNWEQVERQIRSFVVSGMHDLSVYTGTFGIFQINKKDYYLHKPTSQVPVPKYFWKIVLKNTGTSYLGVAIIGLNDVFNVKDPDPCQNVIDQITWLKLQNAHDVPSGYVIACNLNNLENIPELQGVLSTLPDNIGLLVPEMGIN